MVGVVVPLGRELGGDELLDGLEGVRERVPCEGVIAVHVDHDGVQELVVEVV